MIDILYKKCVHAHTHKKSLWWKILWFPPSLVNHQEPFFSSSLPPQVSITDYVVFDQCSLFQTIIQATHTVATAAQAPVEKVADKLRMAFWSQQLQCQPSLLGVNGSGVWISSGKNEFHVAKGNLIGGCAFASNIFKLRKINRKK